MTRTTGSVHQPSPEQLQWELRTFFFWNLIRQPLYGEVKERLRPLWEDVLIALPEMDPHIPYKHLPGLISAHSSLGTYIAELQYEVAMTLRCHRRGEAAHWVCEAVHGGVSGSTVNDSNWPDEHQTWVGSIEIFVTTTGGAGIVTKIDGVPLDSLEELESRAIGESHDSNLHTSTPFQQWEVLRKQGRVELGRLLSALKDRQDEATREWPRLYPNGRATRTLDTIPKLIQWLVGREKMFGSDRVATRDLLRDMGLDPPTHAEKFR